jgi:hypothetical protein
MSLLFAISVGLAIVAGVVSVGLLFMRLRGFESLAFPAPGFVVSTPLAVILPAFLELAFVILAMVMARYRL